MSALLLYDGDCGFCSACIAWMVSRTAPSADVEAWQVRDLGALGLTEQECAEMVQWIGPRSERASGAEALARFLLTGNARGRVLGRALCFPIIRSAARHVYRVVASNRYRLPANTCSIARSHESMN